eukprot:TRINITY_DN281_c0_g3_i2.p1 TRINITY_DN281_c0_g3~~TRINITY_DN281_c0_g3_i2.p1  ORF type:complete len:327 (+),score=182.05 TRINITY_DN281_c0_g3_i2:63-1043(+)
MSRVEEQYKERFAVLTQKTYAEQARWFLNGFWDELQGEAELLWRFVHICAELDLAKKAKGSELDEFQAHRFLEQLGETLTVAEMRNKLRDIDIDFNRRMALIEYLIFKFNKNVKQVVSAPQGGDNKEEMEEAQRLVNVSQAAVDDLTAKLESQRLALEAQQAAEAAAQAAEAAAAAAEAEQKAALEELNAQQESLAKKMAELTQKSEEGSVVQRGRAKQELEQLKAEDPLPLRRAKINQEASVRKAEKARKSAQAALSEAENARKEAEESTAAVEASVAEAQQKLQEALNFLQEVQMRPGQSYGDLWWMQREIEEKKKYLPKSKQR